MASDNEASCVSDPNFAVICSFLECFGKSCGIEYPDIKSLQKMIEDTHEGAFFKIIIFYLFTFGFCFIFLPTVKSITSV